MTGIKTALCAVLGATGSFVASLFGGWTEDIVTLLVLMTVDFVMGLTLAGVFHTSNKSKNGTLDSRAGWMGLCKKGVTLCVVLIAHRLDVSLSTDYIKTAAVIGFIANETISIIENAGLMGIPLPSVITKAVEVLRNSENGETYEDN